MTDITDLWGRFTFFEGEGFETRRARWGRGGARREVKSGGGGGCGRRLLGLGFLVAFGCL